MVKGVSKCVIEVNNTDSEYFERAILFVRPEKQDTHDDIVNYQAIRYLKSLGADKKRNNAKKKVYMFIMKLALMGSAGALIAFILMNI